MHDGIPGKVGLVIMVDEYLWSILPMLLILAFIQMQFCASKKTKLLKSFLSSNFVNIGLYEIYLRFPNLQYID